MGFLGLLEPPKSSRQQARVRGGSTRVYATTALRKCALALLTGTPFHLARGLLEGTNSIHLFSIFPCATRTPEASGRENTRNATEKASQQERPQACLAFSVEHASPNRSVSRLSARLRRCHPDRTAPSRRCPTQQHPHSVTRPRVQVPAHHEEAAWCVELQTRLAATMRSPRGPSRAVSRESCALAHGHVTAHALALSLIEVEREQTNEHDRNKDGAGDDERGELTLVTEVVEGADEHRRK